MCAQLTPTHATPLHTARRPQSAGLDSAAITWGLLGRTAALCRLGGAVVLAVAAGLATPQPPPRLAAGSPKPAAASAAAPAPPVAGGGAFGRICVSAVDSAADVFPMVLLGLMTSTALLHYLPAMDSMYQNLRGVSENGGGGEALPHWAVPHLIRLAVLATAVPLQLCEHTTVTLAAAIQKAVSTGHR